MVKVLFALVVISVLVFPISASEALLAGIIFTSLFQHPFQEKNKTWLNWALKTSVIGLGFGMSLSQVLEASYSSLSILIVSFLFVLVLGFFLARILGVSKNVGHLISSGTAICGGSAIASISPLIKASEKEMSISLGVVFLLNAVALFIFPTIGTYFNMTQSEFGLWAAIAIHDTSSVVGAAMSYGHEALEIATSVKLARVLWIIPLSFITIFLFKSKGNKIKIPWFIFIFLTVVVVNSFVEVPSFVAENVVFISKRLLVASLFLVRSGLSLKSIKSVGPKPLLFGVILWFGVSILSLVLILN